MKSKDFGLDFARWERYTYTKKNPRRASAPKMSGGFDKI